MYEVSPGGARFVGHRKASLYCAGGDRCGDEGESGQSAEDILSRTIAALQGCEAVLCARIGFAPWGRLEAAGIQPNGEHAMAPIETAVMAVYEEMRRAGKLLETGDAQKRA